MRILIVASSNSGRSSFITQQVESIIEEGIEVDYYWIKGKGFSGYLKNLNPLRNKIKESKCDIVHAHYGLSGLLACLQRIKPVIVTFHGSDIYLNKTNRLFSFITSRLSNRNIFVHPNQVNKIPFCSFKSDIIPCGVDVNIFYNIDKNKARQQLNFKEGVKYILFSSNFDNEVKNYNLAKSAIDLISEKVELIELKGYNPEEVNILLNAVDLLLVTSKRETGPMIVKEAMICGCPIVSTDVGDVKKLLEGIDNSHIISKNCAEDFCLAINKCISNDDVLNAGNRIFDLELSSHQVSKKILKLYKKML